MTFPSYLEAARNGQHTGWRYLAGTALILFIWLVVGGLVTAFLIILLAIVMGANLEDLARFALDPNRLGTIPYYVVLNVSFIFFLGAIWLTMILVHRRPLRTLITGAQRVSWRRIWTGFIVWIILAAGSSLVEYLIWPETFSVRFDWRVFVPFFFLAIVLTPIQTTSEELFFRGYLVQGGSLLSRRILFLSIWSGVLFTLPHLANPEVSANLVLVTSAYFVLGFFLAWISVETGSIELALGIHAGNNLFVALIVTFPDSALPTPAIFHTTHFDSLFSLLTQVAACLLFYLIVLVWPRRARQLPDSGLTAE